MIRASPLPTVTHFPMIQCALSIPWTQGGRPHRFARQAGPTFANAPTSCTDSLAVLRIDFVFHFHILLLRLIQFEPLCLAVLISSVLPSGHRSLDCTVAVLACNNQKQWLKRYVEGRKDKGDGGGSVI